MKIYRFNKWLMVALCAWAFLSFQIGISHHTALAAIIINYDNTDLSKVPQNWITQAKTNLRIAYQHTSHGSQLVTGIAALKTYYNNAIFNYPATSGGYNAGIFLNDYGIDGASDLGNPNYTAWYTATQNLLNRSGGCDRNVVIWSWCGQADTSAANISLYLSQMNQLEQDFPGVQFVYMTGHLNGGGQSGNLHQRNEQIRAYCNTYNKILYDFADIESYDPSGITNYMLLNAGHNDDGCQYDGGNWGDEWIAAHPGSELAQIAGQCGGCAHSETLNCVLKGQAFWWLMARLAGWNGVAGPTYTISGTILDDADDPVAGVVLSGLPGSPVTTNASGQYTGTVSEGWTGTVTPTLTSYAFNPTHIDYSNVTSNQTNQNYTATPVPTYTISGTILHNGAGLENVAMQGLPGNPVTNATGFYSVEVNEDWTGTVTPTLTGYNFSPSNRSYPAVTEDQTGQDYTATHQSSVKVPGDGGGGGGGGCFIDASTNGLLLGLLSFALLLLMMTIRHIKTRRITTSRSTGQF